MRFSKTKKRYVKPEEETFHDSSESGEIEKADGGRTERRMFALGVRKSTALVKIRPRFSKPGLWLDIGSWEGPDLNASLMHALGKAGFYSAAFVLQRVLADALDLDPQEIEVASMVRHKIHENENPVWVGEIVLADRLANGSGFVRELSENFSDFSDLCLGKAPRNSALKSPFAEYLLSEAHAQSCMTACPRCLQTYFNSVFHGLLDWRLGVMTLRAIVDKHYVCGLDMNFDYPEFRGQAKVVEKAAQLLITAAREQLQWLFKPEEDCPVALLRSQDVLVGVAPGIWTRDAHEYYPPMQRFIEEHNPDDLPVCWVDVFNTLRQTTWVLKVLNV